MENFNITLDNSSVGTENVTQLNNNSFLFEYPCENHTNCTFYRISIPEGEYLFELWGGEGGYCGGKGGYAQGVLNITEVTEIEIHIGAKGPEFFSDKGVVPPGYNGGGQARSNAEDRSAGAGGGGTDVRIGGSSLNHRVIVAGGGGGGTSRGQDNFYGGAGGGVEGKNGTQYYDGKDCHGQVAYGGNQTSPGIGEVDYGGGGRWKIHSGSFGFGGYSTTNDGTHGGGGGGWYGGAGGAPGCHNGGGGGSGYVLYENSYKPDQYAHNNSTYYFTKPYLADGTQLIPMPSSHKCETGHRGNGAFKLTILNPDTEANHYFFYPSHICPLSETFFPYLYHFHFHFLTSFAIFLS